MSCKGIRICPKCGRHTQVGYGIYECLCCGHVTDLRRGKNRTISMKDETQKQGDEVSQLKARIAELEAWKESALQVEREWDAQAVARMLNVPLGASIRSAIAKRAPILVEALERIADQDYRGNRSHESEIAYMALWKAGMRK